MYTGRVLTLYMVKKEEYSHPLPQPPPLSQNKDTSITKGKERQEQVMENLKILI